MNRIRFSFSLILAIVLGVVLASELFFVSAPPTAAETHPTVEEVVVTDDTPQNDEVSYPAFSTSEPIVTTIEGTVEEVATPVKEGPFQYIEIIGGCGEDFEGQCVVARSGPGGEYPAVFFLRNHAVLKVADVVEGDDGDVWYKIDLNEWLRYPERVTTEWYVGADVVRAFTHHGEESLSLEYGSPVLSAPSTKRIVIDRTRQTLVAYDGETVFMEALVSTGDRYSQTPLGTFTVFKKTPSRYMQGPLPGYIDQTVYDLPGVPWNLYFTYDGAIIHGTYWHDEFGSQYSHGCVNLTPMESFKLYEWADLGTVVEVVE